MKKVQDLKSGDRLALSAKVTRTVEGVTVDGRTVTVRYYTKDCVHVLRKTYAIDEQVVVYG